MLEIKWRVSGLESLKIMEARNSKHSRSKSDLLLKFFKDETFNGKRKASHLHKMEMGEYNGSAPEGKFHVSDVQTSLKQEIVHLQEQLHCQFVVRQALEKAISHKLFSQDTSTIENSIPKAAMDLIKDIAALEQEIVYLEQNLLSLYRKMYLRQVSPLSAMDTNLKLASDSPDCTMQEEEKSDHSGFPLFHRNSGCGTREGDDGLEPNKLFNFNAHQSFSLQSSDSACSVINSPLSQSPTKGVDTYHSLPLSMLEQSEGGASNIFGELIRNRNHIPNGAKQTPSCISEEMIKCISAIYCELAEPGLIHRHSHSSPIPFSSSIYERSSQDGIGFRIPKVSRLDNPFHSREFTGTYCKMLKVNWISRDSQKLKDIEHMLQNFRLLAHRLEEIEPAKMKHKEKLAFWINVHNSLAMHALLVHGIPKNSLKRMSFLLKASYNIGGRIMSIDSIQSSILGIRLPRPGQWLKLLFPLKSKLKASNAIKHYAIERSEPLLYFALCTGHESDPAVRIYTAKGIYEELEAAKEEYIQSTLSQHKEQKILLPKIIESFAKDSGLSPAEMVERVSPNTERRNCCQNKKHEKGAIYWIPHSFNFQFLLSKPLFTF